MLSTRNDSRPMTTRTLLSFLWLWFLSCHCDVAAASRQVVCPADASKLGYVSIIDMNDDIEEDFVSLGGSLLNQREIYEYNLCPHTVFTSERRLMPLLNNSRFYCHSNCTIYGNEVQVELVDYPQSNAAYVSFRGITFSGSTLYAIGAFGNRDKTVDFHDCHWDDGVGNSAIQIEYRDHDDVEEQGDGGEILHPFLPELNPWNGTTTTAGNEVTYMDMGDFEEDDKDNNGVADIFDLNRRRRRRLVSNHQGMTVRIYDSTFANTNVDRYSAIYNSGSLFLKNVTMKNFNGAGVLVNTVGGEATIEHCHFEAIQGISVIRAINSTGITVRDSMFSANAATGIITAIGSDDVVISKCLFLDNFCPKGSEILVFWSAVEFQDSCFLRSTSQYGPVYSSATAETSVTFVHGERITGDRCAEGMFVEDVGSACFDSSTSCSGQCEAFTAQTCAFDTSAFKSGAASVVVSVTATVLGAVVVSTLMLVS